MNHEVDVGAVLKGQRIFLFRLEIERRGDRALQRLRAVDVHCHVFRKQHLRTDSHGGRRRRKRKSKDRFIGESSKKPVRGTPSAGGACVRKSGCFLEIEFCVSGRTARGVS